MAPPQVQQEYIPPTYGQLFMDTYLKTHRQRMQTSLSLAQQELATQQALLTYYAKKEKEYLEYIEGVGTAGTGRGSGGKSITDKRFERQKAALQLKHQVKSDASKRELSVEKFVEDEFSVPVGATGSINQQARQAALNLATSMSNANTAIRGTTGFKPGTNEALASALTFYSEMKAQAALAGRSTQFDANDTAIKNAIANHFGVVGMNGVALMSAPQGFQQMKEDRKADLKRKMAADTLSDAEIAGLLRMAGIKPATTTTAPVAGKGPSATAQEQEDIMASRLEVIQRNMTDLEQKIQEGSQAENMLERAREIYRGQYTQAGPFSKRSRGEAAKRKMLSAMTPEQRFIFDSLTVAKSTTMNPYFYVEDAAGMSADSLEAKAHELYKAIIANADSGKPIDIASMAAKMSTENQSADKIAGLALKAVLTHAKENDPLTETKAKQDEETTVSAIDQAQQEIKDQVEVQQEQLKQAQAKANAPVDTSFPEAMDQGAPVPFDKGIPAFGSEQEVLDFLAQRAVENPQGIPKERIQEIVGEGSLPSEIDAIQKMSMPKTQEELAQEAAALSPQMGETYFSGKANESYGYKVVPGGVQFIFSNGKVKSTVFDEDSAQYKEMLKFFEKTKQ